MFDYGGDSEKPAGFPPTHDPSAASGNGFTPISPAEEKPPAEVGGEFLVPANMMTSPPPSGGAAGAGPPPKGPGGRKGRVHHHHYAAVPGDMDDYFKEGEEKSRKEDYGASMKTGSAVPPPPKIGAGGRVESPRAETRSPAPVEAGDSDS